MAEFCTNCGRPLPESGICPCRTGRARGTVRRRKNRGEIEKAARALPSLWLRYLSDPIGTSRLAQERCETTNGLTIMAATVLLSFLSAVVFVLRFSADHFGRAVLRWAATGLFAPVIAFALTFGLIYVLTVMSKMHVSFLSVVAAVGAMTALPMTLLALSIFLSLIHITVYYVFCVMIFAAWALSVFLLISQVFGIRLNLVNCLITVAGMTLGYYAVALLRDWMLAGLL